MALRFFVSESGVGIGVPDPTIPLHVGEGGFLGLSNPFILVGQGFRGGWSFGTHSYGDCSSLDYEVTGGGKQAHCSYDARVSVDGIRNYDHVNGYQFQPSINTTGKVGYSTGLTVGAYVVGTLDELIGVHVTSPAGAGTVNRVVGLKVDALPGPDRWLIYCDGGVPSMTGPIGVNCSPQQMLELNAIEPGASCVVVYRIDGDAKAITGSARAADDIVAGSEPGDFCVRMTSGRYLVTTDGGDSMALEVGDDGLEVHALQIKTSATPSSSTATGKAGQIQWDADYLYVCVAANAWKRAALSTW